MKGQTETLITKIIPQAEIETFVRKKMLVLLIC